jgi:hypothetical protein
LKCKISCPFFLLGTCSREEQQQKRIALAHQSYDGTSAHFSKVEGNSMALLFLFQASFYARFIILVFLSRNTTGFGLLDCELHL